MPRLTPQRRILSWVAALATAVSLSAIPAAAHAATRGATAPTQPAGASPGAADSQNQALAEAKASGRPVPLSGDETSTSSLTANPNGTFTLTSYAQPVRKDVNGAWRSLNATLVKNADGTVSPTLSTDPLALSGGGTAPLVTLHSGAYSMSLSLPVPLPAPVLSGDTATYRSVIPGVDLEVSVTAQGGFSDVFVVHDAAAAADPELSTLLKTDVKADRLKLSVGAAGTVEATTAGGRAVFTAPAPDMWDSSTNAAPNASANAPAAQVRAAAKAPVTASSVLSPGSRAHEARLGEKLNGDTLSLTPDSSFSSGKDLTYPLYEDPAWAAYSNGSWATVSANYPTQSYWDSSAESGDLMQVGNSPDGFWADTLINFNIPTGEIFNGGTPKFESATFYATNYATDNPATSVADLYAPSATLSQSNDYWNAWFGSGRNLGSAIGSASFAQNATKSVGFPISTSWITPSKGTQTFALAGDSYSDEQSNTNLYKVFYNPSSSNGTAAPNLSLTFSHAPTVGDLSTSPAKSTIGNGSVALNAHVADVDGGTLSVTMDAYITGHTNEVIKSSSLSAGSGTTASMWLYQSVLNADITSSSFGNTSSTTSMGISWSVTVSNGNGQSVTSSVENFTYSTAQPGAPNIWSDSAKSIGCPGTGSYTVGTPATFYLTPEGSTVPTSYTYQLNGGLPISVPATDDDATITVTPTSQTSVLSVSAIATSGNIGQTSDCTINAAPAANAAPGDMVGGSGPDLLIPGSGSSTLPSGLWLATGSSNGTVNGDATNIGLNGNGASATDRNPNTFDGTQVITGLFQGSGFNAVLDYSPNQDPTTEACSGQIIDSTGNGLALNPDWGGDVTSPVFTIDGGTSSAQCATSVANGGNLNLAENGPANPVTSIDPAGSGDNLDPDLLVVEGGSLFLEPNTQTTGGYSGLSTALPLADVSPAGGSSTWSGWSIYTLDTSANLPYMFAVNRSTGAVYYYSVDTLANLVFDVLNSETPGANATPVEVAGSGFATSNYTDLEATSVGATPALWAVAGTGAVSTFELDSAGTGLSGVGSSAQIDVTAHSWSLNDDSTSASDSGSTPVNLAGSGSVQANSGDLFSPDIEFTTGTNGKVSSSSQAIDLTKSFTISAWIEPDASGMMPISVSGTQYPGLMIYPTGGQWTFYLAKDNGGGTTWDGDSVVGGAVQLGAWAHVQASFNATTHVMSLYVDDTLVATGSHTAPTSGATGDLQLGCNIDGGTLTSFFTGQIAQLQTWNGVSLAPTQQYTPASYHQSVTPERILDTRQSATNSFSGMPETDTPLGADATLTVPVVGDTVTPTVSGAPTKIPSTATAVAVDVTLVSESSNGNLTAYADGAERPITSSTNYGPSTTVTGYQIVPVGQDGKIDLYNSSTGTTHILVDLTGYFTSDATLSGDQTYHPLATAYRDVNTGSSDANTNLPAGTEAVAAGTAFTVNVTGVDQIPTTATAVAMNLTTTYETAGGYLEAYATGAPPAADTALSYGTGYIASMSADIPLGTGGTVTVVPEGAATRVIADISGYYTNDLTGQAYHSVNPTRLVDTRLGVGGTTGAVGADSTYALSGTDTQSITAETSPTLALMLTVTQTSVNGVGIAYPAGTTQPSTSNLDWTAGQTIANLALTPASATGAVDFYNDDTGTTQLVVDCSGYFANDAQYSPDHQWPLIDGQGTTAADTVGDSPLSLVGSYSWQQAALTGESGPTNVLGLDGTTAYGTTGGPAVNTAGSFTVAAWAELSSAASGYPTVVAQSGNNAAGFYLQYNASWNGWCLNFMSSDTESAPGLANIPCSTTVPTADTWYHLVGTYDAVTKTAALYVNGALADSVSGITPWAAKGDLTVGMGQYDATAGNYFPGDISGVETFNYALSAAQTQSLYEQGS